MGLSPATDRDKQMSDEVVATANQDTKQREHEAKEGLAAGHYDPCTWLPMGKRPMGMIQRGRTQRTAGGQYWATGGGHHGYEETGNDGINQDPNMRVWQRIYAMEGGKSKGLSVGTPRRWVQCDKSGQDMMERRGREESWRGRWLTTCLHQMHHFTHVAACDASLNIDREGVRTSAVGVFEGAQPDWEGEGQPRTDERKMGDGMWGAATPAHWEIADAEMYAIYRVLKRAIGDTENDLPVEERHVLIMSDCESPMGQIEQAMRRGYTITGRDRGGGAMLEAICKCRAQLGRVVIMYTPGHSGVSPNEYADAIAKAHTQDDVEEGITADIAAHVTTRPCIYEHATKTKGLRQGRIYQEASKAAAKWACAEITTHSTCTSYLPINSKEGTIWKELVQEVGSGGGWRKRTTNTRRTPVDTRKTQQRKEMAAHEQQGRCAESYTGDSVDSRATYGRGAWQQSSTAHHGEEENNVQQGADARRA
jgi:ribonuclease HI